MKKLILFGTRHYTPTKVPKGIQDTLNTILDKFAPQVVLEEWSEILGQSAASEIASAHHVSWKNIGTPQRPELKSFGIEGALDFPESANIQRYGPLASQEKRENLMCDNIIAAMSAYETGVVVIGLGHLHSMMVKLSGDFDVDGYGYGPELF